ncbi:Alpha/beta hydrolase family protein [Clostridiales bacterium CHKCI001]|nr:Alpha/beta hydrolase family protein [Clostridiales bacterium CHKCI001]
MNIPKKEIKIKYIPAAIWGNPSKNLCLYIHGQGGNKEEASPISEHICKYGYQILSIDLPEHGDRKNERNCFDPWHVIPELKIVMHFAKHHWTHISLLANSIGVWFSMLSFKNEHLKNSLFVSPVLDMKRLILNMMIWENVSETQLKKERIISTSFGQTLSWEYWKYVLEHPIERWNVPTKILYGKNDPFIDSDTVKLFSHKFDCELTAMENGEHWFHTEQQLNFMYHWLKENLADKR